MINALREVSSDAEYFMLHIQLREIVFLPFFFFFLVDSVSFSKSQLFSPLLLCFLKFIL